MRITTDTNVLVSATFWWGAANTLLLAIKNGEISLILSEDIIEEFERVLEYPEIQRKIKQKNLVAQLTVEELAQFSEIVTPIENIYAVLEDPSDNKILECAVAGEAEFIVTYDQHLLRFKEFRGIRIVTPEEFVKVIK